MDTGFDLSKIILLLIPILVIQIGLQIAALLDLHRQPSVRGPKWVWVLIIVLGELLGPVIYYFFGRKET